MYNSLLVSVDLPLVLQPVKWFQQIGQQQWLSTYCKFEQQDGKIRIRNQLKIESQHSYVYLQVG